jgi:hypothetical protein
LFLQENQGMFIPNLPDPSGLWISPSEDER